MTATREAFEPPEKHRASDAVRSGATRLIHDIGEALGDADQPAFVDRRRRTTFDAVLNIIDSAFEEAGP